MGFGGAGGNRTHVRNHFPRALTCLLGGTDETRTRVNLIDNQVHWPLCYGSVWEPTETVGSITQAQIRKIAEEKLKDLNTDKVESAMNMVAGTAKSMGIKIEA